MTVHELPLLLEKVKVSKERRTTAAAEAEAVTTSATVVAVDVGDVEAAERIDLVQKVERAGPRESSSATVGLAGVFLIFASLLRLNTSLQYL